MKNRLFGFFLMWGLAVTALTQVLPQQIKGTGPVETGAAAVAQEGTVLFSTFSGIAPNSTSITSQNFTDFGGFATAAADDFTIPSSEVWNIDSVVVDGAYFNGQPNEGPAESINVYIVGNSAGLPNTTNLSAGSIYALENASYLEQGRGDFQIFTPGLSLSSGVYWLVVQANMAISQGGQWGIRESSAAADTGLIVGFESAWTQNMAFIGPDCVNVWGQRVTTCGQFLNDGTPVEPDLAFALQGTVSVAGITVSPTSGLVTSEAGGTADFSVVLDRFPTANVTIGVSTSNGAEGNPSTASLVFTPVDWDIPQIVTVTGADDAVADGNIAYTIILDPASSTDPDYSGLDPDDVSVTNLDDDIPGITVLPTSGLTTDEGGATAMFSVNLNTVPTNSVTLPLSVGDPSEGTLGGVTMLIFNDTTPQMVTVTGLDDDIDDGDVPYTVITGDPTSIDPNYNNLGTGDVADVFLTNLDDLDTAGISVIPSAAEPLITDETGTSATYDIVLDSEPLFDVTVNNFSTDFTEGSPSPFTVTFTPVNWNMPQTITVTGQNDAVADGNIAYVNVNQPAISGDPLYDGLDPADVSFINNDDADLVGVTVTPNQVPLVTSEAGGMDTFDVVLNSQPMAGATVTIDLASGDATEGTPSTNQLIFTDLTWNIAQTVIVTGQDDPIADGNVTYAILLDDTVSVGDPAYDGVAVADVACLNQDDGDMVGVTVTPNNDPLQTTEAGGSDTFTIVLTSQPTADVTINASSDNPSEATVSPPSFVFTNANWNMAQMGTATGVDDDIDDGNAVFNIILANASSADPDYDGLDVPDMDGLNQDDDTAGITVNAIEPLTTDESGTTDSFTIVLDSEPVADVSIGVDSSDLTEGVLSTRGGPILVFTAANWDTAQTVTVTGQDDNLDDGDINYTLQIDPASSADPLYNGIDPADLSAVNQDDDVSGFDIMPTAGLVTTEAGGSDTFTVALTAEPTANVDLPLMSSDPTEGTVAPPLMTFTAANWNIPQIATVTGVDDPDIDGDIAYTILTGPASSGDGNYNGLDPVDVGVTNFNDDFCQPVVIECVIGGPITVTGGFPGCVIDLYQTNGSLNPADWTLLAAGITIGPDGTVVIPGVICEADTVYVVTEAGNPDNILSNFFRTVPTLGTWGLVAFTLLLLVAGMMFLRKRRLA